MSATLPASRVALLLFGSGLCALVYQVAWLRLLRLIFGTSTAAAAATLAVFMAGLGLGSLVLGHRADARARPLLFYARLEAGIALAAAASPWLVDAARHVYLGLGGSTRLGPAGGPAVQLALSAVVMGLPAFLMGGTLPAAVRAVEQTSDAGRRLTARIYGSNTLGAVAGALLTTFLALEHLGVRRTIWAAGLLNLGLALAAGRLAAGRRAQDDEAPPADSGGRAVAPAAFVLAAAAGAGFVFFLLELVWYRMLAPVLGGSSYTFGLILAVALAGVGLGGLIYGAGERARRPTLSAFAGTCAAEAFCLLVPYALGDRIAVAAMLLRPMGDVSFGLLLAAWTALTALVVLPAAIVAGYQFPLLIALLGAGSRGLGREVGLAYAANTAGAVLGAVAGGFGLIALGSAPVLWIAAALLLLVLAAVAVRLDIASGAPWRRAVWPAVAALATLALAAAPGPSAVWRHTPTGAGGMPSRFDGPNDVRRMSQAVRRAVVWERDGRESSVALHGLDEVSLLVGGKADGSALRDAPTQVMSGLIGAVLHPDPRRALVIGLGTGSTAGWLAEVPGIERVDVVELEPAVIEVARACAPVNHGALDHPRVHLAVGDGREFVRASRESWDLIFSEPSNPYRAGVASLFTRELYLAAAERLGERGIFLQWLQGYHVDAAVVRTMIATLASVFPHVESWQVSRGDLLLVAAAQPIDHDLARVRRRVEREPLLSALRHTSGVAGAEGFYAGYLASTELARAILRRTEQLNTDDFPVVEFGFARGLGRDRGFSAGDLAALAAARGEHLPQLRGRLDWRRVLEMRAAREAKWGVTLTLPTGDEDFATRVAARNAYVLGDLEAAGRRWDSQTAEPSTPIDRLLVAEALAEAGDPGAPEAAARLAADGQPVATDAVLARYHHRTSRPAAARDHLLAAFRGARTSPWAHRPTLERALVLASKLAAEEPLMGLDLFGALGEPFAVRLLDDARQRIRLEIAQSTAFAALCEEAFAVFEPHVPWEEAFLESRHRCYETLAHPLEHRARADLETFRRLATPAPD